MSVVERAAEVLADDAWDALYDTDIMRCCWCPSCNHYLPEDQYKPDEPCEIVVLIKVLINAHVAEALAAAGCLRDDQCRWCPPGCKSCEPQECECYTHQDFPDRALRDDREASSDVEAVAETICEAHVGEGCRDWSDETEVWREAYRDMARAVLARIPCAARDDRRISVMDAIDALEAVFDAYDQAPALHPTAPPEHPAHLRAEGALRASEILRGRCRSAVVEALHTPDREGETVTEWGVRYSRDHEIEERTKESAMRAQRQPTTARAFSRQRTRFPDIVTDWTPVTDGGDPS